jgi:hypothetical protein
MKFRELIFFIFLFLFVSTRGFGQKTDTIFHINGNILTGDFKKLAYGVITWKMDGMGTISLETPKVNTIISNKKFEIKMKNGLYYFGSFDTSGIERHVKIIIANGAEDVKVDDIVEVYPIKRNFWLRTKGTFSLGINYSKGSDIATVAFSGNLNYRKRKSNFTLSWEDNNTFQADTLQSTRIDGSFNWERLLSRKWSIGTSFGFGQNSELGYQSRFDLNLIGIYDLVYNKWNRLYLAGGLSGQRETPYDSSAISNDLTGIVATVWKVYKYTNPKIWIDASVVYVPYITTAGRHRVTVNLSPKISVISDDLKIGYRFYYTYDSKPTAQTAKTSDWGINLEISYSFH